VTLRFCSTKILNVTAVQFSGYGWIEALKEIYPGVEVQITPYVSAVTLFWNKQHRYLNPNDWAGQVPGMPSRPAYMPCPWLHVGWLFVSSLGEILTCCLDVTGETALGNVSTEPRALLGRRWRCCATCYQFPPGSR
jgi:hypothetical protein